MLQMDAPFVQRVARSLTPGEQLVVMLVYGEELSVSEVADVMETSVDHVSAVLEGVHSRVRMARSTLIEALVAN